MVTLGGRCADESLLKGKFAEALTAGFDSVRLIVTKHGPSDARLLYSLLLIAQAFLRSAHPQRALQ